VYIKAWDKPGVAAAPHALIGEAGAVQLLPWRVRGWHAGGKANDTHIGIELCEPAGHWYEKGYILRDYNAAKNAAYFAAVWGHAVELCAMLCELYGITVDNIVSHAEAHALGLASNHADVGHWFPLHGKSMDGFRSAVQAHHAPPDEGQDNVPDTYAIAAVDKAVRRGALLGDERGNLRLHEAVTRQDMIVVLERLGLL